MLKYLMIFSLFLLTACLPDMNMMGGDYRPMTVEVSKMTTPATGALVMPEKPPLYCKIGRGSALFGREWYDFSDTLFALHQGLRVNINVSRVRSSETMTIQVFFDGNGQKLIFCPVVDAAPNQRISCASLYALEDDLQDGIKRTFDIPAAVRGGMITCAYNQASLKPLNTPVSNGN